VPDRMKLSVAVLLLPPTIFEDAWTGARRGGAAFGPLADDQAPLVQRKESDRSDRSHEDAEHVRRDPKRTYVASVWTSRIDVKRTFSDRGREVTVGRGAEVCAPGFCTT
jgi:hypothetical protein